MVIYYLQKQIVFEGMNVLHLAPEKHIYAFLSKMANVTTADLEPGYYKHIDRTILKEDATCLSFADKSFDLVIANHILEHIPKDRLALSEIFRVLKDGASAILQVPYSSSSPTTLEDLNITNGEKRSALYGQNDHVRIYSLGDYTERLRNAGFGVENIIPDPEVVERFAFRPREVFFRITKPTS
jgi:SAM-dependent methyltransferase